MPRIHDSRLLKFELSGDLALRLNWGRNPAFLMSVGGFHPRYPLPSGLRQLNRLALSLSGSDNPRIRFETYLALTSNSIQMGARVSLYAVAGGFGVDGGGAFDALIQWSPFYLDVSFEAWVRIFSPLGTLLSARVAVQVTGPEPWHVSGVAEVQILFLTVRVAVDFRLGEEAAQPEMETVDLAALLWQELSSPGSWQAVLPPELKPGVTLSPTGGGTATLLHPLATLVGRQRIAPLDQPISRVGARRPAAGTRSYRLSVQAPAGVSVRPVAELFAPAQYQEVSEDAKLSGPSFVPMNAGAEFTPAEARAYPTEGLAASDLVFETREITSLDADAIWRPAVPADLDVHLAGLPSQPQLARSWSTSDAMASP